MLLNVKRQSKTMLGPQSMPNLMGKLLRDGGRGGNDDEKGIFSGKVKGMAAMND